VRHPWPIAVVAVLVIVVMFSSGCSYHNPTRDEIVPGNNILHFEPYPMGGGGQYVRLDIVGTKDDHGTIRVGVAAPMHGKEIWVTGNSLMDGHLLPGFTVPEWRSGDSNAYVNGGSKFGPESVVPPAERVPEGGK